MKAQTLKIYGLSILLLTLAVSLANGCNAPTNKTEQAPGAQGQMSAQPFLPFEKNVFGVGASSDPLITSLNRISLGTLDYDLVDALSDCLCAPNFYGKFLEAVVVARGPLPQPLVPTIRTEIQQNQALQLLFKFGKLGQSLATFFATDDKLAAQVRDSINEKLRYSIGADLRGVLPRFRFDGFATIGPSSPGVPANQGFATVDVARKWLLVMSLPNLWTNGQPLRYGSHALQLLASASVMNDWNYAMGVSKALNGHPYGGLSFNPDAVNRLAIGPSDPRTDPNAQGVISGIYEVSFGRSQSSLDLALNGNETWRRLPGETSLKEQTAIWRAAAKAFGYFRPISRSEHRAMFDPNHRIFPKETYQLALAFLPGLGELLDGPFINENARVIYRMAHMPGAQVTNEEAPLDEKAALLRALIDWAKQLSHESDLGEMTPGSQQRLRDGAKELKKAARFVLQNIIARHTSIVATKEGPAIGLAKAGTLNELPAMASSASALSAMMAAEEFLPSAEVRTKIIGLYHWFARNYLVDGFGQQSSMHLSPVDILWTFDALERFQRYKEASDQAVWYQGAMTYFKNAISNWDNNF